MRSQIAFVAASLVFVASCSRSLELPPPPGPPAPGTVQGTVKYAVPGRASLRPANGAVIELLGTNIRTQSNEDGRFLLDGITTTEGRLLIRFDLNADSKPDFQKVISLAEIQAGVGRNVALGEVELGKNASVVGKVRLSDKPNQVGGLSGTAVFVPEGPFSTTTADDGSFILSDLPPGPLALAIYRAGYTTEAQSLDLRSGEEFRVGDLKLVPRPPGEMQTATATGKVTVEPVGDALDGTKVSLDAAGATSVVRTTNAQGVFTFETLVPGLYNLTANKTGYGPATLFNVLINAGANDLPAVQLSRPFLTDGGRGEPGTGGSGGAGGSGGFGGSGGAGGGGGMGMVWGPPVAIIEAGPSWVAPDAGYRLDGAESTGKPPLTYFWVQDGGIPVALSANFTVFASAPSFTAPSTPTQLIFHLRVADADGVMSANVATANVYVARPPTAVVTPNQAMLGGGQAVVLSASSSTDPNSLALSYQWTLLGDAGTLTPLTGKNVTYTAPIIGPNGTANVRLIATNAFGVPSPPVSAALSYSPSSPPFPTFTVDAGPNQVFTSLDAGIITLRGSVSSSNPMARFNVLWTPESFGAVLDDFTSLTPTVLTFGNQGGGGDRDFGFLLEVQESGVTNGPTVAAHTRVILQDWERPYVTSVDARYQSVEVRFSETLNAASVTASNIWLKDASDAGVMTDFQPTSDPASVVLLPRSPLVQGAFYTVHINQLEDSSQRRNKTLPATFTVPAQTSSASCVVWHSSSDSTGDIFPGLFIQTVNIPFGPSLNLLQLFGRLGGGTPVAWALLPVDTDTGSMCQGGMLQPQPVPTDSMAPAPMLPGSANAPLGRRGHLVKGEGHALLSTTNGTGAGVWLKREGTATMWSTLGSPPAPSVQCVDDTCYSLGVNAGTDGGFRFTTYNSVPPSPAWATTGAETVDSDSVTFASNAGLTASYIKAGSNRFAAVRAPTGVVRVYWHQGASMWPVRAADLTGTSFTTTNEVRLTYARGSLVVLVSGLVGTTPQISAFVETAPSVFTEYPNASGGQSGPGFDVFSRGDTVYLATSVGGHLTLRTLDLNAPSPAWATMQFNSPGGLPNVLNRDTSCVAAYPEVVTVGKSLFVAWQETCFGKSTITARRID